MLAANKDREERRRAEEAEKTPKLLAALKELGIENKLTSIRDELWKLGSVTTDIGEHRILRPSAATARVFGEDDGTYVFGVAVTLNASWPFYTAGVEAYWEGGDWHPGLPEEIAKSERSIRTTAFESSKGNLFIHIQTESDSDYIKFWHFEGPNLNKEVEKHLVAICIGHEKEFPYDQQKERDEANIIKQIQRGFRPSKEYLYFLDRAGVVNNQRRQR